MENKKWYQSLTIWAAAFVALLQGIPELINQINLAAPGLNISSNPIVMKVLTIMGIIVTIYGRLTAKTALK